MVSVQHQLHKNVKVYFTDIHTTFETWESIIFVTFQVPNTHLKLLIVLQSISQLISAVQSQKEGRVYHGTPLLSPHLFLWYLMKPRPGTPVAL